MKSLRELLRQWENVTGRMRGTIVKQYEAWLGTPTRRFTLDIDFPSRFFLAV